MKQKIIWVSLGAVAFALLFSLGWGTRKWLKGINQKAETAVAEAKAAKQASADAKNGAEKAQSAAERGETAVGKVKKDLSDALKLVGEDFKAVKGSADKAATAAQGVRDEMPVAVNQAACGIMVDAKDGECTKACMEGKKIPAKCFPATARAKSGKPKKTAPPAAGMPLLPPDLPPPPGSAPGVSSVPSSPLRPRVIEVAPPVAAAPPPAAPAPDPLAGLNAALGGVEGALDRTEAAADEVGRRLTSEEAAVPP